MVSFVPPAVQVMQAGMEQQHLCTFQVSIHTQGAA